MDQRCRGNRCVRLLTALAIAFDVIAVAIAAARDERTTAARPVVELLSAPEYTIRVFHPDTSVQRAMPCLQQRDADSTEYAALPVPGSSLCHLASAESAASHHRPGTRTLGIW